MKEYQTYHYKIQNIWSKPEVNKIMGQNILKCVITEVKGDVITKVSMINCIFVTYGNVAYVPHEVVSNCFRESFPFICQYRPIIL